MSKLITKYLFMCPLNGVVYQNVLSTKQEFCLCLSKLFIRNILAHPGANEQNLLTLVDYYRSLRRNKK